MQICCALEVGTFFPQILQRMAIMAILSSITPLLNSQTSNKQFELIQGRYSQTIHYLQSIPDDHAYIPEENQSFGTRVGCVITGKHYRVQRLAKLILLRKKTATRSKGYPIYLVKNDPVNTVISTSYRLMEQQ